MNKIMLGHFLTYFGMTLFDNIFCVWLDLSLSLFCYKKFFVFVHIEKNMVMIILIPLLTWFLNVNVKVVLKKNQ